MSRQTETVKFELSDAEVLALDAWIAEQAARPVIAKRLTRGEASRILLAEQLKTMGLLPVR